MKLICSARAGNVIGGGDWAANRIVPDCIKAWTKNNLLEIRDPNATRPWQHVLEPLSGYLRLAQLLTYKEKLNGESFNFGPSLNYEYTVSDVVKKLSLFWSNPKSVYIENKFNKEKESRLLRLNCDKALSLISWKPTLTFDENIEFTGSWYSNFYSLGKDFDCTSYCIDQINNFTSLAKQRGNEWI